MISIQSLLMHLLAYMLFVCRKVGPLGKWPCLSLDLTRDLRLQRPPCEILQGHESAGAGRVEHTDCSETGGAQEKEMSSLLNQVIF